MAERIDGIRLSLTEGREVALTIRTSEDERTYVMRPDVFGMFAAGAPNFATAAMQNYSPAPAGHDHQVEALPLIGFDILVSAYGDELTLQLEVAGIRHYYRIEHKGADVFRNYLSEKIQEAEVVRAQGSSSSGLN